MNLGINTFRLEWGVVISMNGNKKILCGARAKSPMYVCGCIYIVRKETRLLIHILIHGYVVKALNDWV